MVKRDVLACEWSIEIHQPCNQALKGMQLLRLLINQYNLNKQTTKRK